VRNDAASTDKDGGRDFGTEERAPEGRAQAGGEAICGHGRGQQERGSGEGAGALGLDADPAPLRWQVGEALGNPIAECADGEAARGRPAYEADEAIPRSAHGGRGHGQAPGQAAASVDGPPSKAVGDDICGVKAHLTDDPRVRHAPVRVEPRLHRRGGMSNWVWWQPKQVDLSRQHGADCAIVDGSAQRVGPVGVPVVRLELPRSVSVDEDLAHSGGQAGVHKEARRELGAEPPPAQLGEQWKAVGRPPDDGHCLADQSVSAQPLLRLQAVFPTEGRPVLLDVDHTVLVLVHLPDQPREALGTHNFLRGEQAHAVRVQARRRSGLDAFKVESRSKLNVEGSIEVLQCVDLLFRLYHLEPLVEVAPVVDDAPIATRGRSTELAAPIGHGGDPGIVDVAAEALALADGELGGAEGAGGEGHAG